MTYDFRVATWADVESVLDRLSDQHRAEYAKLGVPDDILKMRMIHFMMGGETKALWFDGLPQAILAISPTPEHGPVTWLAVTREYFEKGLPALRAAKVYMKEAVKRHGTITSFIGSEHPDVTRWLTLIGFELVGEKPGLKVFRYR